jgi:hypothetical protein
MHDVQTGPGQHLSLMAWSVWSSQPSKLVISEKSDLIRLLTHFSAAQCAVSMPFIVRVLPCVVTAKVLGSLFGFESPLTTLS